MKGMIFDIKEFAVHDGDGLVATVFLKGCPLKCLWCHNPEGQSFNKEIMVRKNSCKHCGQCKQKCDHAECQPFKRCVHICPDNLVKIVGEEIDSKQLALRILKNKNIMDAVTFSGGEPLAQGEFLLEVINHLEGLKVNIETSGYCDSELFKKVLEKVDFVFYDVKIADEQLHKKYTNVSNKQILKNLEILKASNKPCLIRTPLIENITDTQENLRKIQELIQDLPWQKLPANKLAAVKYQMLEREYPL